MALILNHQTKAQFVAHLRVSYMSASKEQLAQLATLILGWIEVGDITDTQVRNAFGLTVNQWNTLKTKMTNLRANYNAVLSSKGE